MSISENIISPLGKCPRGSACWENACWGTVLEPLKTKAKMLFISTISQTKTVMKHRTKMDWNKLSIKKETNMLERGINLKKGGEGWCRNGGLPLFYYLQFSSVPFTACVCRGGSKVPFITFRILSLWVCHARFSSKSLLRFSSTFSAKSCTKTWYHLHISDPFR